MWNRQPVRGGSCSCSHRSAKFTINFTIASVKARESVRSFRWAPKAALFGCSSARVATHPSARDATTLTGTATVAAAIVPILLESLPSLGENTFESACASSGQSERMGLGVIGVSGEDLNAGESGLGVILAAEDEAGNCVQSLMSDEELGAATDKSGFGDIHSVEDEAGISTRSLISRVEKAGGNDGLGTILPFDKTDLSSTTIWETQQQTSVLIMDASSVFLMARMESCRGSNASAMSADTISAVKSDGPCGSMGSEQRGVKSRDAISGASVA